MKSQIFDHETWLCMELCSIVYEHVMIVHRECVDHHWFIVTTAAAQGAPHYVVVVTEEQIKVCTVNDEKLEGLKFGEFGEFHYFAKLYSPKI